MRSRSMELTLDGSNKLPEAVRSVLGENRGSAPLPLSLMSWRDAISLSACIDDVPSSKRDDCNMGQSVASR